MVEGQTKLTTFTFSSDLKLLFLMMMDHTTVLWQCPHVNEYLSANKLVRWNDHHQLVTYIIMFLSSFYTITLLVLSSTFIHLSVNEFKCQGHLYKGVSFDDEFSNEFCR